MNLSTLCRQAKSRKRPFRRYLPGVGLCLFLTFLAGCSILGSSEKLALGSDNTLTGEAQLTCSKECSDRGQCGKANSGDMVLLNSSGPATVNHDMAIVNGTAVGVLYSEQREVVQISDNLPMQANFYLVDVPGRGPGWVAGWCVGVER